MALAPYSPGSGEDGNYNRIDRPFHWYVRTVKWSWKFESGDPGPFPLRAQALVDDKPYGDWVESRKNSLGNPTGIYDFTLTDVPNGHHKFSAQFEGQIRPVRARPFLVNDTGAALPAEMQTPRTCSNRFEEVYGSIPIDSIQVPLPAEPPKIYKRKKRNIVPANGVHIAKTGLWVSNPTDNISKRIRREVNDVPGGDLVINLGQNYFHENAINGGDHPPSILLRDGPRGEGTLGYVSQVQIRRGRKMVYFLETDGRFGVMLLEDITTPAEPGSDMTKNIMPRTEGDIATMVGWRIKPGEIPQHPGTLTADYMHKDKAVANRARYDSKWEMVGDWSKVPGPHNMKEPWTFVKARRLPNGKIDTRDGLEVWVWDTLNHRGLFFNMWTGHPAFYRPAQFPPVGYVSPPAPTGAVDIAWFAGSTDGKPTGEWNEPWGSDIQVIGEVDGRIWVSMFAGNSICSLKMDGSDFRVELKCALQPTDAQLGIPLKDPTKPALGHDRLGWSKTPVDVLRANFKRDGPAGVASCVRPQGIKFNSQGKLIFVEMHTYLVREFDPVTKVVRTIAEFPKLARGSASASTNEISLAIDTTGDLGTVDDIYVSAWHMSDWRWSKDGVYKGQWAWTSGAAGFKGRMDQCICPDYVWGGPDFGDGIMVYGAGNASGSAFWEVSLRQPTDPVLDLAKWQRGNRAWHQAAKLYIAHGPGGQARIGFPSMQEIGSWTDAAIKTYLSQWGVSDFSLDDVLYFVRWETHDLDYTEPEPATATVTLAVNGVQISSLPAVLTIPQGQSVTLQLESNSEGETKSTELVVTP